MTRRIEVRLNERLFKPLLDSLDEKDALSTSYNDLVAKCVFWAYLNKDTFPVKNGAIVRFLRLYKGYRKHGLRWLTNQFK